MDRSKDKTFRRFQTTKWSLVVAARDPEAPTAREALTALCRLYWPPLYAFVRRQGYSDPEAQDLTQAFFARLLEKNYLKQYRKDRGRFRTFLVAALKHFIANEWHREHTLKRTGDAHHESIDILLGERPIPLADDDVLTPEAAYERQWGLTVLAQVVTRLREYYVHLNKGGLFDRLQFAVDSTIPTERYATLARELGTSEGAVKVWVHRIRKRYRDYLYEEIAATVADPSDVESELDYLRSVLSG